MKKIYIIGIVASGKTTLARKLSQKLGIPWYELDCIIYNDHPGGRHKRTPEQQVELIHEIDKAGQWIVEGTYRQSCHCLLDMADTIIFLDPPLWKRKFRILKRFVKQQLGIEKCHYKSNMKMLKLMYRWTGEFEAGRQKFEGMLRQYKSKVVRVSGNSDLSLI
ncbi:hypothetical protein [Ruminiclostridium cellobioparum]|uniref:Adenylate kinase n=1 Tax=Ruminiclostridium cellobioparum subsp. termitidis CT1112 TaxID=1195236 RepID=S0FJH9_RUMCE|nr:hypothetical protein CTER_2277 [Ruminiclostridium cellobioparum subsp. termitidis CT1112]